MAYDLQIGAATIYMEAAGEPPLGKLAVAYVLLNRLAKHRFGQTLTQVCLAPLQFSSWNTSSPTRITLGLIDDGDPILSDCANALQQALKGFPGDPTQGATLYYADYIEAPSWARRATFTVQIGKHKFFTEP